MGLNKPIMRGRDGPIFILPKSIMHPLPCRYINWPEGGATAITSGSLERWVSERKGINWTLLDQVSVTDQA